MGQKQMTTGLLTPQALQVPSYQGQEQSMNHCTLWSDPSEEAALHSVYEASIAVFHSRCRKITIFLACQPSVVKSLDVCYLRRPSVAASTHQDRAQPVCPITL